jgi:hypothetical protein
MNEWGEAEVVPGQVRVAQASLSQSVANHIFPISPKLFPTLACLKFPQRRDPEKIFLRLLRTGVLFFLNLL